MMAADLHRAWRELPIGTLTDLAGAGACLILAPHPDDESLGCGGLIAALCQAGRPPVVAVLTDGAGSHPGSHDWPPESLREVRSQEVRTAAALLGLPADRLVLLRQPDSHAPHPGDDAFDAVVTRVRGVARDFGCDRILATWEHDPHCDHLAAWHIAAEAVRRSDLLLMAFPVWGWTLENELTTASVRGFRLDISGVQVLKRRAIQAHASQLGRLITDDPAGFALPDTLLAVAAAPFETFLLA
jgi:LmbE family N-acetylglucosaminyl deacetylase